MKCRKVIQVETVKTKTEMTLTTTKIPMTIQTATAIIVNILF